MMILFTKNKIFFEWSFQNDTQLSEDLMSQHIYRHLIRSDIMAWSEYQVATAEPLLLVMYDNEDGWARMLC